MATTLYRIYDPNFPNATRYYGITDSTINLRLYEHTRLARIGTKRMPVLDWIRKLQKENTSPCIETIAVFDTREQARQAEIEHIEMGRKLGYKLLNLAKGGDGGRQPEEVCIGYQNQIRLKTCFFNNGSDYTAVPSSSFFIGVILSVQFRTFLLRQSLGHGVSLWLELSLIYLSVYYPKS